MRHSSPLQWIALVLALTVLSLASCSPDLPASEALSALDAGTPRAQVLSALPDGGIRASLEGEEARLVNGYWRDAFFIEGRMIEIIWVHDPLEGFPLAGDFRGRLNPVIIVDDLLDGWGWRQHDRRREEWGIPDRPLSLPEVPTI